MGRNKIKTNEDWFVNKTNNNNIPANVKWLLSLGPKHALPITKTTFPLFKCIADCENIIQTVENREKQEISRSKITQMIDSHLNKLHLTERERFTLNTVAQTRQYLEQNKNILIIQSDKGNKTVALEKEVYNERMKNILSDMCMYKRLKKDPTSVLQNRNNQFVEKLHNLKIIDLQEKYKLIERTAVPPRLYGLPKIHKDNTPLRPICSSLNSPSYKLCKYMTNILKNLTKESKYNVRDAIEFKGKISAQKIEDDEILMSFDVVSLFPSIPVKLALKIIEEKWDLVEKLTNVPKKLFLDILKFCIMDTRYFKYDKYFYGQRKGLPMGSPASPVIADIVMEELLDRSMEVMKIKPKILTKYVDDLFAIVKKDAADDILKTINSFNGSIQFTTEIEENNKLPYLDCMVIREGQNLKLNWYKKSTSSGRLVNFYSKHPRKVIINTATNFIRRVLEISHSDFYMDNIRILSKILEQNDFPIKTIQELVKHVENKRNDKIKTNSLEKIYKSTIYIPGFSERFKNSNIFDRDKCELAFRTCNSVSSLFTKTKSKLDKGEKSNLIYEIKCSGDDLNNCNKVYIGTTKTKLKTRLASHKTEQKAINKPIEQKTALAAHCVRTGHKPDFNNTRVLQEENNYKKRFMLEMLHIIDVSPNKRINYKTDTDKCAQLYRHTVRKHSITKQKLVGQNSGKRQHT